MDIEGAECEALSGATHFFQTAKNLDFAICTYHRRNDCKKIKEYLDKMNCIYKQMGGYLFVKHRLRKAIIRGQKK